MTSPRDTCDKNPIWYLISNEKIDNFSVIPPQKEIYSEKSLIGVIFSDSSLKLEKMEKTLENVLNC